MQDSERRMWLACLSMHFSAAILGRVAGQAVSEVEMRRSRRVLKTSGAAIAWELGLDGDAFSEKLAALEQAGWPANDGFRLAVEGLKARNRSRERIGQPASVQHAGECRWCGAGFVGGTTTRRFCSSKCYDLHVSMKRKKARMAAG